MGQGVVWYTGQFYAQSFIETVCKISFDQSRTMLLWGILFATPFFIVFGSWSDRVGRKWIMLVGMLLAISTYHFIFQQFLSLADPAGRTEVVEQRKILEVKNIVSEKTPAESVSITTSEVHLELSAPNRAGILLPAGNDNEEEDVLMLVMPVMLNS